MNLDLRIEFDSADQSNIDQWLKWSEVADSMDYDFDSLPWEQFIDQNDDWLGEFLNVDWRDQYRDFVEYQG